MQYHIETVDPKFLDLRQFPLSPTLHDSAVQQLIDRPQSSDDSLVGEENDTDFRHESDRGRRRSSSDHLDILGPFEFSNTFVYRIPSSDQYFQTLLTLRLDLGRPKKLTTKENRGETNQRHILQSRQRPYHTGSRACIMLILGIIWMHSSTQAFDDISWDWDSSLLILPIQRRAPLLGKSPPPMKGHGIPLPLRISKSLTATSNPPR